MKDIFISYSNENKGKVSQIVSKIVFFGPTCWFQPIDSKQNFIEEINNGINNSSSFVVFLSNASIQSIMVRNEISRAIYQQQKDKNYAIIPVVIEDLTPENAELIRLFLGSFNWLYENKFKDYESLALAIFEQANIILSNKESQQSSYAVENENEKIRLKAQNKLLNTYAKKYLDNVFANYDNPIVLDVGCNNGENTMARLGEYKYSFILGIDKNQHIIEEANQKYSSDKCSFVVCDIVEDNFFRNIFEYMQQYQISGFDIIHISAVLLHIGKVGNVLKDLYAILKKGGTIFIQDEDDGANIAYPDSKYFSDCFFVWEHSKKSGDRKMGRKIPLLLKQAGFCDIELLSTTISSIDFKGTFKEELWDLYFNPELWAADSAEYFDCFEAVNLLEDITDKHSDMKKAYLDNQMFIALGIFFFIAQKR